MKIKDFVEKAFSRGEFSFDFETEGLEHDSEILGLSLAIRGEEDKYESLFLVGECIKEKFSVDGKFEEFESSRKYLDMLFESKLNKIAWNATFDCGLLFREGIEFDKDGNIFDAMVARKLLFSNLPAGLKKVVFERYGYKMDEFKNVSKSLEKLAKYSMEDAIYTLKLWNEYKNQLGLRNLDKVFKLEMKLIPVIVLMEQTGVKVDREKLLSLKNKLECEAEEIDNFCGNLVGYRFNLNSPMQVGKVLFEDLKLPVIEKTSTGRYATGRDILKKLSAKDTIGITSKMLRYREIGKTLGYINSFLVKSEKDGRMRGRFNSVGTQTGRFSSNNPNFQNITYGEDGQVRKAIISGKDKSFVVADYSQIELRVLAHLSHDERMVDAFRNGEDIHQRTANELSDIVGYKVSRSMGKTINFGIVYGMGPYGLSQGLGISEDEAKMFLMAYFERFSSIKDYADIVYRGAKINNGVTTFMGRFRDFSGMNDEYGLLRRLAINTKVQGSAADIVKMAMVKLAKFLKGKGVILIQVHDELVVEVGDEYLPDIAKEIKHILETAVELIVPLVVDVKVDKYWVKA